MTYTSTYRTRDEHAWLADFEDASQYKVSHLAVTNQIMTRNR